MHTHIHVHVHVLMRGSCACTCMRHAHAPCTRAMHTRHAHTPCTRATRTRHAHTYTCTHAQVMRRLIDDIVAGIKEHFKMKTDKGETEEVTLKEVQTLAKKWSSRCVARACARLQPYVHRPRPCARACACAAGLQRRVAEAATPCAQAVTPRTACNQVDGGPRAALRASRDGVGGVRPRA